MASKLELKGEWNEMKGKLKENTVSLPMMIWFMLRVKKTNF